MVDVAVRVPADTPPPMKAEFPVTVLLFSATTPEDWIAPPPRQNKSEQLDVFSVKVVEVAVTVPADTPPPMWAVFPVNVLLFSVSAPEDLIAPP